MSTQQSRHPAGSPDGGRFAPTGGAESTTTLHSAAENRPRVNVQAAFDVGAQIRGATREQRRALEVAQALTNDGRGAMARQVAKRRLRAAARAEGWPDADTMYLASGVHNFANRTRDQLEAQAATNAAIAAAGRNLIGHHGYTQSDHDAMTWPWRTVFPEPGDPAADQGFTDAVEKAMSTAGSMHGGRMVALAPGIDPKVAREAARRHLRSPHVQPAGSTHDGGLIFEPAEQP